MSKETKATGFYRSHAWRTTSTAYRRSVGGLCERCLAKGIITPAEVVHHKIPLTPENIQDLSISLNWDNLQALCRQCHAEVHEEMYRQRTGRRYKVDKNGRVVIDDTVL